MKFRYLGKSDEELIGLITKRDDKAFEELYARYSKKMYTYFFRMLGRDTQKAEDFLHDLFLKVIEKPESFDRERRFSTWFYSIASNMCKNEYKKARIHAAQLLEDDFTDVSASENQIDSIDMSKFMDELYLFLEAMDDEHKETFLLRYASNLTLKEIADIQNCPEGTVKSRLYYTVRYLSKHLKIYNPKVN